jgi:hypothetical protein
MKSLLLFICLVWVQLIYSNPSVYGENPIFSITVKSEKVEKLMLLSFKSKIIDKTGVIEIYNSANTLVLTEPIEVINAPYHSAFNIAEFKEGTYKVIIKTESGKTYSDTFSLTNK